MNTRVLLLLAGGAAALWSIRNWRRSVQLAMVLLIFEGAFRKWVFPGSQDLVYFAKDVLLLGAYAGYLRSSSRARWRLPALPLFYAGLGLAVLLGLLEIFNPALPNLLVGVFGFKAYFFYVPLLFVLPDVFPSDGALLRFLRRYALIAVPVGALAVAQFFSPASSFLNTYARSNEENIYIATFGSSTYVRVTATFSFITGYTSYLIAAVILLLGLLAALGWRFQRNLPLFVALVMTIIGMLMTGSRGPVLMLMLLFPLYWWLAVIREQGGGLAFGRLILALALLVAVVGYAGQDALGAFLGRAAGVEDVRSRLASPLEAPLKLLPEAGLVGFGIGATHQTAVALAPRLVPYSWLRPGLIIEVETGRVMVEMGGLGFVLIYFLRLYLVVFALRQVFVLKTRFHRAVAVMALLFFLTGLPASVIFDVISDVYYWFFAGLLFAVVRLDREAAAAGARAVPVLEEAA
ncbi:MAG TPA: hypothetical protein VHC97_25295 [Thermoanaerobaculia bacterium]|jgi:hypothetical protein|nr:hypothetical protein [Thermoanaerobaculia bacterium]